MCVARAELKQSSSSKKVFPPFNFFEIFSFACLCVFVCCVYEKESNVIRHGPADVMGSTGAPGVGALAQLELVL